MTKLERKWAKTYATTAPPNGEQQIAKHIGIRNEQLQIQCKWRSRTCNIKEKHTKHIALSATATFNMQSACVENCTTTLESRSCSIIRFEAHKSTECKQKWNPLKIQRPCQRPNPRKLSQLLKTMLHQDNFERQLCECMLAVSLGDGHGRRRRWAWAMRNMPGPKPTEQIRYRYKIQHLLQISVALGMGNGLGRRWQRPQPRLPSQRDQQQNPRKQNKHYNSLLKWACPMPASADNQQTYAQQIQHFLFSGKATLRTQSECIERFVKTYVKILTSKT